MSIPPDDPSVVADRLAELRGQLDALQQAYLTTGTLGIPEAEFDLLIAELAYLSEEYPEATPGTAKLLQPASYPTGLLARHLAEQPAYATLTTRKALTAWLDRFDPLNRVCGLLKHTGVAVELIYRDGVFAQAVTRGDGWEGSDVTAHVRGLASIPARVAHPGDLSVTGTLTLRRSQLAAYNAAQAQRGGTLHSTPAVAVASLLHRAQAVPLDLRRLEFIARHAATLVPGALTMERLLTTLGNLGFRVPEHTCCPISEPTPLLLLYNTHNLTYGGAQAPDREADGVYVVLDALPRWGRLGPAHRAAQACTVIWRFEDKRAVVEVTRLSHHVGKHGVVTPHAEFAPITLGDVWVGAVPLAIEQTTGVGVGAHLEIALAGRRLPVLKAVLDAGTTTPYQPPTACPACQTKLAWDGQHLRCGNPTCPGTQQARLVYAASSKCLRVPHLGALAIADLCADGELTDLAGLLTLSTTALTPYLGTARAAQAAERLEYIRGAIASHDPAAPDLVHALLLALCLPELSGAAVADVVAYLTDYHATDDTGRPLPLTTALAATLTSTETLLIAGVPQRRAAAIAHHARKRAAELDRLAAVIDAARPPAADA